MCKILVSTGGFKGCWVSHAISESENLIKPIASEGVEEDYFRKTMKLSETKLCSRIWVFQFTAPSELL